jgi:hypothetical protein
MFLLGMMVPAPGVHASDSAIRRDETVVFYPTYGCFEAQSRSWRLDIHGVVFEPETSSLKRAFLLSALRESLPDFLDAEEKALLERRLRLFLVDHERGKAISVRLAGRIYPAGVSKPDGHFQAAVQVAASDLEPVLGNRADAQRWVRFQAVTRADDPRVFSGRVRLLEPTGLSVVSDIDDTIKISQVRDRKALVANTFLRPFRPVPGMAALYRRLAQSGAAFHYVSGSPWQLYPALCDFCEEAAFPEGTFHLKTVRLTDSTALPLLGSQEAFKMAAIGRVLADFPGRRFVLIGDTGEQDPEVFGQLARQHREQIEAVLLRNVTAEVPDGDRMRAAREGVPESKWLLFREPTEIQGWVDRLL